VIKRATQKRNLCTMDRKGRTSAEVSFYPSISSSSRHEHFS